MKPSTSFLHATTTKAKLPPRGQVDVLLRITPPTVKPGNIRAGVNIAIAVDTSGSMNEPIDSRAQHPVPFFQLPAFNPFPANPDFNPFPANPEPLARPDIQLPAKSKISQAIYAACQAVDHLSDGDRLSLVVFNGLAVAVVESTPINPQNRGKIKSAIHGLMASGVTDLHSGWLMGAEQAASFLSSKQLNRVLVLSDGHTNHGKTSIDDICADVSRLNQYGISTSTFGIGEHFNEDILEKMAGCGSGNFYFIEHECQLSKLFHDELSGINHTVGQSVELEFRPGSGVSVTGNKNQFILRDGKWLLPDLLQSRPLDVLVRLDTNRTKAGKKRLLGPFILSYLNNQGESVRLEKTVQGEVVAQKAYDALKDNHEVGVANTLLEIAIGKRLATEQMSQGQYVQAEHSLRSVMIAASTVCDSRTLAEASVLNSMLDEYGSSDKNMLRKTLTSQAYNTRMSK